MGLVSTAVQEGRLFDTPALLRAGEPNAIRGAGGMSFVSS